jgi:hypothetical protein
VSEIRAVVLGASLGRIHPFPQQSGGLMPVSTLWRRIRLGLRGFQRQAPAVFDEVGIDGLREGQAARLTGCPAELLAGLAKGILHARSARQGHAESIATRTLP